MSDNLTILLYEQDNFLSEVLSQTRHHVLINPDQIHEITPETRILINDKNFHNQEINKISYIAPVLVVGNTKTSETNNNITRLAKPTKISDVLEFIKNTNMPSEKILKNAWIHRKQDFVIINYKRQFEVIQLTSLEKKLILYLSSTNQKPKNKIEILQHVFEYKSVDTNTLETHISRLRKKIEPKITISHSPQGYSLKTN